MAAALLIVSGFGMVIYHDLQQLKLARTESALAQVDKLRTSRAVEVLPILANLRSKGPNLKSQGQEILPHLRELWGQPPEEISHDKRMRIGMALLPMEPDMVKEPLYEWMLNAPDVREAIAARETLKDYKAELIERLWNTVEDRTIDQKLQFRALVALAAFDSEDERWQAMGDKVVEQLLREEDRLSLH